MRNVARYSIADVRSTCMDWRGNYREVEGIMRGDGGFSSRTARCMYDVGWRCGIEFARHYHTTAGKEDFIRILSIKLILTKVSSVPDYTSMEM